MYYFVFGVISWSIHSIRSLNLSNRKKLKRKNLSLTPFSLAATCFPPPLYPLRGPPRLGPAGAWPTWRGLPLVPPPPLGRSAGERGPARVAARTGLARPNSAALPPPAPLNAPAPSARVHAGQLPSRRRPWWGPPVSPTTMPLFISSPQRTYSPPLSTQLVPLHHLTRAARNRRHRCRPLGPRPTVSPVSPSSSLPPSSSPSRSLLATTLGPAWPWRVRPPPLAPSSLCPACGAPARRGGSGSPHPWRPRRAHGVAPACPRDAAMAPQPGAASPSPAPVLRSAASCPAQRIRRGLSALGVVPARSARPRHGHGVVARPGPCPCPAWPLRSAAPTRRGFGSRGRGAPA
jgi:hypothetical protein